MSKSQALLYRMSDTPAPKLAKIFVALSVGVRIRIIRNIAKHGTIGAWKAKQGRGCTIKEAGLGLQIGWPTLSHHVSVLEKVEMITIARDGRFKRCWISPGAMGLMSEFFMSLSPRFVPDPTQKLLDRKIRESEDNIKKNPFPKRTLKPRRFHRRIKKTGKFSKMKK